MGPPVVGDLNGDGNLDIVVPCARTGEPSAGQLSIFLGDGSGGFRSSHVPTGSRSGGLRVALGDVNGDGHADVVLTRHDEYTIRIYLGDGSGSLTAAPDYTTAGIDGTTPHTHSVALADVNADGKLDVITGNADDNAVAVLLGNGAGRFRPSDGSPFPAGNHPYESLSVADVNGDGKTDIVVPNLHGHTVTVLFGDGKGGFEQAPNSPVTVTQRPGVVAAGRIDADPLLDLVATHEDDAKVTIIMNFGSKSRASPTTIDLPELAWTAVLADLDANGSDDLVLGGRDRHVMVLYNDGQGRFQTPPSMIRSQYPHPGYVAVADINSDGRMDLVVGHFTSGRFRGDQVEVLLGQR